MSRIAIITNSLTGGGAERAMNLVANGLHEKGHEVYLIAINDSPSDIIAINCEVIELKRSWKGDFLTVVRARNVLKNELKKIRPEIILINCELPELLIASLRTSSHLITVEHTSLPWRGRRLLGLVVRLFLTLKRSRWVSVSKKIKVWPPFVGSNFHIANPITPRQYLLPQKPHLIKTTNRIAFVGRLSPEKRPDLAIAIASELNIAAVIIGDGLLRPQLERMAETSVPAVTFLGFQSNPWQYVTHQDLVIVPSSVEGDGLVVLEALQLGHSLLLADNTDLRKFNLPDRNYFSDVEEAKQRIAKHTLEGLRVPGAISEELLSERRISVVISAWEEFLGI